MPRNPEVASDAYAEKYARLIEQAFNNGDDQHGLYSIINKIYEDGYEDGVNSEE